MSLARILVDGYSLLHAWLELAPGRPRFSAAARDELIHWLTRYQDATGTPISLFFDGSQPIRNTCIRSTPQVEILYSRAGQTADSMIERVTHRLLPYGPVLVVTDDHAEQDTVTALGGMTASCANFIGMVGSALGSLEEDVQRFNRRAQQGFSRPRT
jgi:predicted RNA-binding protein with PIN domain